MLREDRQRQNQVHHSHNQEMGTDIKQKGETRRMLGLLEDKYPDPKLILYAAQEVHLIGSLTLTMDSDLQVLIFMAVSY